MDGSIRVAIDRWSESIGISGQNASEYSARATQCVLDPRRRKAQTPKIQIVQDHQSRSFHAVMKDVFGHNQIFLIFSNNYNGVVI